MTAAELIDRIRTAREQQSLSQAAAAEAAGISQPTWHLVERGRKSVLPQTLVAMAAAVGLSVGYTPERYDFPKSRKNTRQAIDSDSR